MIRLTIYLRDICHPQLPKEKLYEELIRLLTQHFVERDRVTFYTAKQEKMETVALWFARIKNLSIDCKFGDNSDGILMDQFISGLGSSSILDRLYV